MNELLAFILLIFDSERSDQVIGCEPEFLLHDTYLIFEVILEKLGVEKFYEEDLSANPDNQNI